MTASDKKAPLRAQPQPVRIGREVIRRKGRLPETAPSVTTRIFVEDVFVDARIGIHPHEHDAPQPITVSVEVVLNGASIASPDTIDDTLNYETIVSAIEALTSKGHIPLVETLAHRLADICLQEPRAAKVRVRVTKLSAFDHAAGVGCEIEKSRSA